MKYRFIFLLLLSQFSCYESPRNCQDFKTGYFESIVVIDETTYTSSFKRFGDLQIEYFNGKTDSSSVRWINDCEVIFKTINPTNRLQKKNVLVKILTTEKDGYHFEYGYINENKRFKGYARRLE